MYQIGPMIICNIEHKSNSSFLEETKINVKMWIVNEECQRNTLSWQLQ